MKYKSGIMICMIAAVIPVVLWASTGRHFATRYECKTAICKTTEDCICTRNNGCLDFDEAESEEESSSFDCKSRKLCFNQKSQKFKLTSCTLANDCTDAEFPEEGDWSCADGKQCYDEGFGDFVENAEAPLLPCFQFGLTPSGLVDGVLPSSGALIGLAMLLLIVGRPRS